MRSLIIWMYSKIRRLILACRAIADGLVERYRLLAPTLWQIRVFKGCRVEGLVVYALMQIPGFKWSILGSSSPPYVSLQPLRSDNRPKMRVPVSASAKTQNEESRLAALHDQEECPRGCEQAIGAGLQSNRR